MDLDFLRWAVTIKAAHLDYYMTLFLLLSSLDCLLMQQSDRPIIMHFFNVV